MKERPILFSGDMVRAILDGSKTMTRRPIIPQPRASVDEIWQMESGDFVEMYLGEKSRYNPNPDHGKRFNFPLGVPGDRLWVRETWSPWADEFTKISVRGKEPALYRADYKEGCSSLEIGGDYNWHPSIHMPRWASRINLEITEVRVERLQEITEDDAKKEGADKIEFASLGQLPSSLIINSLIMKRAYRYGFYKLWDSIYSKRGYGWDANPWVWVISFKVVTK